jgi:transcriptional regulator with XRE-family HTH domain
MSINLAQLGKAIRQIRELRGYSQEELGAKANLRGNTVALIERGERGVSLDSLNDLASGLNVPAACLTMLGTAEMKGDSESVGLVKSMQELILSTIVAQVQLAAVEDAKRSSEKKAKAISSILKPSAAVRKVATPSKAKAEKAKKKPTVKAKAKRKIQHA